MKKNIIILLILIPLASFFSSCENDTNTKANLTLDSLTQANERLVEAKKQVQNNKKLVADFYQELFGDKNINSIDKYVMDSYIQHNPMLADGKEALKAGTAQWFKGAPKEKVDIQHLSGDGDLVYIHTKSLRGAKTISIIDIFRIENNMIAEHWDVIQEVPEKSANPHPMF